MCLEMEELEERPGGPESGFHNPLCLCKMKCQSQVRRKPRGVPPQQAKNEPVADPGPAPLPRIPNSVKEM